MTYILAHHVDKRRENPESSKDVAGAEMSTTVAGNAKCKIGKLVTNQNVIPSQNRHELHVWLL